MFYVAFHTSVEFIPAYMWILSGCYIALSSCLADSHLV